MQQKYGEVIS